MLDITMTVNDRVFTKQIEGSTLLVGFLRDHLGLTGTHMGCDTSQCGACIVHLDGVAVKSCSVLAMQCENAMVTTIEGLAEPGNRLHPMQEAFRKHHGLQCGFCTSGMVMIGLDIARRHGLPSEATVRDELKGNICRCTGYQHIVDAIMAGSLAIAPSTGSLDHA